MKTVGIFCGSSEGRLPIYAKKTKELGCLLVDKNINIVFGAGSIGLMGHLADTVVEKGGNITGIVPKFLSKKEICHANLTELIYTKSMFERKSIMLQKCDSYIAMPGGIGTFDEIFEVMVHIQLEQISVPFGILNIEGYFDNLIKQLDYSVSHQFIKQSHRNCIIADDNPDELIRKMEHFVPEKTDPNWIEHLKLTNKY